MSPQKLGFWVGFWRPKRSQEGAKQQTARFMKISISYWFFQYEIDVGLSKSKQKSKKKAMEKRSKNRAGFEDLFFPIFASFETILGASGPLQGSIFNRFQHVRVLSPSQTLCPTVIEDHGQSETDEARLNRSNQNHRERTYQWIRGAA